MSPLRRAAWLPLTREMGTDHLSVPLSPLIMIIVELLDARREPVQVRRIADQQHGCRTGVRRRRGLQHVVDCEIPVLGERNRPRIAFGEWSGVFTNECGENLEGRSAGRDRSADGIAPGDSRVSRWPEDALAFSHKAKRL